MTQPPGEVTYMNYDCKFSVVTTKGVYYSNSKYTYTKIDIENAYMVKVGFNTIHIVTERDIDGINDILGIVHDNILTTSGVYIISTHCKIDAVKIAPFITDMKDVTTTYVFHGLQPTLNTFIYHHDMIQLYQYDKVIHTYQFKNIVETNLKYNMKLLKNSDGTIYFINHDNTVITLV